MVGLLGCGCCEVPELCPDVDYLQAFTDDFSPDFEPDWIISLDYFGTPPESLIARDGVCSLRGRTTSPFYAVESVGTAYVVAEKTTLTGTVECQFELAAFPTSQIVSGRNEICRAGIGIWSPAESRQLWFEAVNFELPGFVKYHFRDFVYSQAGGSNLQTIINVTPQVGDVLKLRLSNFTQDTFFSQDATTSTITCLVNDTPVFSYSQSLRLRKCEFYSGIFMRQHIFQIARSSSHAGLAYPGLTIAKVDNFELQSL